MFKNWDFSKYGGHTLALSIEIPDNTANTTKRQEVSLQRSPKTVVVVGRDGFETFTETEYRAWRRSELNRRAEMQSNANARLTEETNRREEQSHRTRVEDGIESIEGSLADIASGANGIATMAPVLERLQQREASIREQELEQERTRIEAETARQNRIAEAYEREAEIERRKIEAIEREERRKMNAILEQQRRVEIERRRRLMQPTFDAHAQAFRQRDSEGQNRNALRDQALRAYANSSSNIEFSAPRSYSPQRSYSRAAPYARQGSNSGSLRANAPERQVEYVTTSGLSIRFRRLNDVWYVTMPTGDQYQCETIKSDHSEVLLRDLSGTVSLRLTTHTVFLLSSGTWIPVGER
ncbi:hypothetical protein [Stieleria neptunia]|uniref:hypothetical protein n=1 Tax=Stieleria neptunia TaxID=2527979 RepID=UPI0011A0A6CD|nr:hypothetical protein [Stieleria neptunia]